MMKTKQFIIDTLKTIAIGFILSFIILKLIMMPCVVEGSSMFPNLHDGDYGYSFIITRNIDIKNFDIAVIEVDDKLLVKRVIGLPNDHIQFKDNKLYINDVLYEENYLNDNAETEDMDIYLSDDEYFCLGDNRNSSRDSRYYGSFSNKDILSTHIFIIYPFSNFGLKK